MRFLLAAACLGALTLVAQEPPDKTSYKLDFKIREDAAKGDARLYSMTVDSNGNGSLRIGNRVPTVVGGGSGSTPQVSYLDIGVNIDCRLREARDRKVLVNASIEMSSIVAETASRSTPSVTQVRTNAAWVATAGKSVMIASIEDPSTRKKFDVEAVVTRID